VKPEEPSQRDIQKMLARAREVLAENRKTTQRSRDLIEELERLLEKPKNTPGRE
jgi:hypothetical protein